MVNGKFAASTRTVDIRDPIAPVAKRDCPPCLFGTDVAAGSVNSPVVMDNHITRFYVEIDNVELFFVALNIWELS
jgi:hypothetical protein